MENVSRYNKLAVVIYCNRCNLILGRTVIERYQTKGGRWDKDIKISKHEIEPHRECRIEGS